jgi:hypothetical protein
MSFILLFLSLHISVSLLFHFCAWHLPYSPACNKRGNCHLQPPLGSRLISPSERFSNTFTSFLHIKYLVLLICKSTMFIFIHVLYMPCLLYLFLLCCIFLILPIHFRFIVLMKTEFYLLFLPTLASISFNISHYIYLIFAVCVPLLLFPSQMEIYYFPFLYI